ncbi:MAG: MerR family transcriptional regulator [Chloroflexota bacterium]|nr:MAG: MerR family transcriptional regulator [Chloroflexota bacterium]
MGAVVTTIRLNEYSTTPLYNIKAVVQSTSISPSTLRAWERRYNMCQPQRSESGYRLYSDRDVAIIRWLKAQVDAGMSISQAVSWLQSIIEQSPSDEQAALPDPNGRVLETPSIVAPTRLDLENFANLQEQLLYALLNYQEDEAEATLARSFALYPVEHVGEHIIMQVLVEIGERWHRGELSITREHYATNYLIQRLAAILRAVPNVTTRPLIWVGCAPGELHEIGALLLSIYLRRAGYTVRYLGQNLSADDLVEEVRAVRPDMVLFSATTIDAAKNLRPLCELLASIESPRPIIGYGGRAFNVRPELRNEIAGVYLGETAVEAVEGIRELLSEHPRRGVHNS